jgi:STELLO glycosyltransferase-like protein
VGDRRGPRDYPLAGTELLTLDQQLQLPFKLAGLLPLSHYVRKNLGYLVAIARQAGCIYETDDDNRPGPSWNPRSMNTRASKVREPGWCNAFRFFSDELIWPRGFPLDQVRPSNRKPGRAHGRLQSIDSPIQQGLVNGSPDVDAIWRLVLNKPFEFKPGKSIALGRGVWCPFNSQSTWWWPEAYPLMYLPSFCTFRMTDIWRSFVAQRCLWEMGGLLTFHAAEVVQERNVHNLRKDFQDEVPGYLENPRICSLLSGLRLRKGPETAAENLRACYQALVGAGIFPKKELRLVNAWLADLTHE